MSSTPSSTPQTPPPTPISSITLQKASASKAFLENHYRGMIRGLKQSGQLDGLGNRTISAPIVNADEGRPYIYMTSGAGSVIVERALSSTGGASLSENATFVVHNTNNLTSTVSQPLAGTKPREREIRASDFTLLKLIGRGAFGEVFICKLSDEARYLAQRTTPESGGGFPQLFALKRMRKVDMLKRKQVIHVRSERNVLAEAASDNPWIVQLHYSFHDDNYLYMVTDYMPGGDLMSWLIAEQIFTVEQTKFYIAELCVAINSVHEMCYVHRDIKPDNILIDKDGHVKLSDFGLCKKFALPTKKQQLRWLRRHQQQLLGGVVAPVPPAEGEEEENDEEDEVVNLYDDDDDDEIVNVYAISKRGSEGGASVVSPTESPSPTAGDGFKVVIKEAIKRRQRFDSIVGSPGYIAPEILLRQRYGVNCDFWSAGVIMYEMLYGQPPFYSEDPQSTCNKIVGWKKYLNFYPTNGPCIPEDAIDLMRHLLCDANDRFDFAHIQRHPFFASVNWELLRQSRAAFIPQLSNPLDTRYFPDIDDRNVVMAAQQAAANATAPRQGEDQILQTVDPRGVIFADFKFRRK